MSLLNIENAMTMLLKKYPKYYIDNITLKSYNDLSKDTEISIFISGKDENNEESISYILDTVSIPS